MSDVADRLNIGFPTRHVPIQFLHLRGEKLWCEADPLFPATATVVGNGYHFEAAGLKREHWRSAATIRSIFKGAFTAAGLPYFNPHSLRSTLVHLAETRCTTPEQLKAWSQNLFGHEAVLTTLSSYGAVAQRRQAEIFGNWDKGTIAEPQVLEQITRAITDALKHARDR